MLEIAKALHTEARLLILDEPTAVLGGHDVDRLLQIVKQLKERGVAVIFISHRLNEIFGLADTYLVLKDGSSGCERQDKRY
jgi:ABC-type sugar transport system ATPase subunit